MDEKEYLEKISTHILTRRMTASLSLMLLYIVFQLTSSQGG